MAGKKIRYAGGYEAFLPAALPPNITWSTQLVNALSRADKLLGELEGEGRRLPNPHILIRPFIRKESVLSSKIEGTQATLGEILAVEAGAIVSRSPDDIKEVNNYVVAMEYGMERLKSLPLSLRLLKELHEKLLSGVRGDHATPGEFRKTQNWIGLPGSVLNTASYVPPPPDHLMECLGQLENFLHDETLPPLIQIALAHYQFEAIHPFLDGNGRVGRLLITLFLMERKIVSLPLLYLSAFFEATRSEYYERLNAVSERSDWVTWLLYCLNGIATQAKDALERSAKINSTLDEWREKLSLRSEPNAYRLIDIVATNPFISINKAAEELQVAYTTAQRALQKLEKLMIIKQHDNKQRNKIFCATKILTILDEPAKF